MRKTVIIIRLTILFLFLSYSVENFKIKSITENNGSINQLRISSPRNQGLSEDIITNMLEGINQSLIKMDSLLIVKNGYLVVEEYYNGYSEGLAHQLYSVTKSVISALTGIAIDHGYFNLNDTVMSFFPNYTFNYESKWKEEITVQHLLSMRVGIEWDEWSLDYTDQDNPFTQMRNSEDWVQYILDKPMACEPGSHFVYNTGASHLLSAIIQQTVNITTLDFANKYLFDPLDIEPSVWVASPNDIVCGGYGLCITPREMAKFGLLFLNNGSWNNQVIIPKEWVIRSTREGFKMSDESKEEYGFQWWISPERFNYFMYSARGYAGQYIITLPELELILILTSSGGSAEYSELLQKYIIPAAENNSRQISGLELDMILILGIFLLVFVRLRKKIG
ncbi:MAG: class C beta-lactamase-related serine hydrolase [Candidatus Heimdallarchaeota archaeon]|nr:class C beta-lactamase-related serine hydrolase [Candidatus Heimdallarchaeota archaeon]